MKIDLKADKNRSILYSQAGIDNLTLRPSFVIIQSVINDICGERLPGPSFESSKGWKVGN
jgi:hypothetical protein